MKMSRPFLSNCKLPKTEDQILIDPKFLYYVKDPRQNEIKVIIAVDGGYTEVPVNKSFPSSTISFLPVWSSIAPNQGFR